MNITDPSPEDEQAKLDRAIVRRERTCWITRGQFLGKMSNIVDIWWAEPGDKSRFVEGENVTWSALTEQGGTALVARWSVVRAKLEFGTVPDDTRQVIKVQGGPRK